MAGELDGALARLANALSGVEAAVSRHFDADARRSDLETELQVMQDDRARLAVEVESASRQLARYESVVESVDRRLGPAIRTVREVLDEPDPVPSAGG